MSRSNYFVLFGATALVAVAAAAATRPAALVNAAPGLWEIAGVPGAKAPARECLGDVTVLAQYEHRGRNCTHSVLTGDPSSTVVEYNCAGAGFGRSKLTMITPRSLRIETQGISEQLPFHYVLQARRVADCPPRSSASAH